MKYCFGIDVGGTTVKLGLFDTEGTVIDKWEIKTRTENGGVNVLPDIAEAVKAKMEEKGISTADVEGAGIGVPGPVTSDGYVNKAVNLGWNEKFNVEEKLSALLELPVKAGNDANVAALGEMWKGGGLGYKNLVMVTLGTGVGGGVILNGNILTGVNGAGGEIGHICVNYNEEDKCGCGKTGCLEQYASATGIVRLAKKKLANETRKTMLNAEFISAKKIWDAVKEQDEVAMEIAEEFGAYLGHAIANFTVVLDPDVVVIGGGVSRAGMILIDYIQKYYDEKAFFSNKNLKFVLAELGNDAGIYGAAKLAIDG